MRILIDPAKRLLAALGVHVRRQHVTFVGEVPHTTVSPRASYAPWLADEEFRATHDAVRGNTLVDVYRMWELWHLMRQLAPLEGDVLEIGVWRGGTGCLMADRLRRLGVDADVFLCDTFQGVVKAGARDTDYVGGEHADTSEEIVRDLAASLKLERVRILKGIFPDDTGHAVESRRFRFVHVDVDVFDSARDILDFAWPRLVPGGMVVFDDYGFLECPGVTRFVDGVQGPTAC